jgi:uncharacterized SAM-binding protein YcdF (DUF218 family)
MVRRVAKFVALTVVVGVLYVGLTVFEVWRVGRNDGPARADVIVVMGAAQYDGRPSPLLQARLDHVVELWSRGVAPVVVVTGGNQPGDRFTEASASANYLVKAGIPENAIVQEDSSRSTWESIDALRQMAWTEPLLRDAETYVFVTDPYHSLRTRLIAEENGFDAGTSATDTSPLRGGTALNKHLKEGLGVATGRLIGFETLWKITG